MARTLVLVAAALLWGGPAAATLPTCTAPAGLVADQLPWDCTVPPGSSGVSPDGSVTSSNNCLCAASTFSSLSLPTAAGALLTLSVTAPHMIVRGVGGGVVCSVSGNTATYGSVSLCMGQARARDPPRPSRHVARSTRASSARAGRQPCALRRAAHARCFHRRRRHSHPHTTPPLPAHTTPSRVH